MKIDLSPDRFFRSLKLRYKVGLAFFLPITLALMTLLVVDYQRDTHAIREQIELSASQLGHTTLSNMRHAMLINDSTMIEDMVQDVAAQKTIQKVWIVDLNGAVWHSSDPAEAGEKLSTNAVGCFECHQYPPAERPQTIELPANPEVLRISIPITNSPECQACHPADSKHLGVLFIDASMTEAHQKQLASTLNELLFSIAILFIFMILGFIFVQWLVVRRVEVVHAALMKLGGGELSARIPKRWRTEDELTELADHFNQIASNLESMQNRREERDRVRVQAIIEERERIARELHDGVAQFLGYLSAKVGATQTALKNQNNAAAEKNLRQIEESIRDQSIEVRSAIIGLKMSGLEHGLIASVREFVDQCNRLDDLQLELQIVGDVVSVKLKNEQALQLFRILQEAVSNIRKHSRATEASIRLAYRDRQLELSVHDNGIGFDPFLTGLEHKGHFGLQIMVERAHAIGAQIEIKSSSGQGTQVIVTLTD